MYFLARINQALRPNRKFIRATLLLILLQREGGVHLEPQAQWHIRDDRGRRKYLTEQERRRFLAVADHTQPKICALCYLLAYAGCRVSEALALTPDQLDVEISAITFRTLKRRKLTFRSVPIPSVLLRQLQNLATTGDDRYWIMHRTTAWRHVKSVLSDAGVRGPMASCKGLRHGFGIRAASRSVPPSLIQRWMGHAHPATTAIYLDAMGEEERYFAERMW